MSVATVWANLRLNISDFASNLSKASVDLRRFARAQQKAIEHTAGYGDASKMIALFNRSLSDTVNITRGIIISQAFYAAVGTIRDATAALWDFNVALDYMKVTYSALFGSTKTAEDFMAVLQEHSIETIFDYQGLADASKKLLAYGIEYKNLMFIMEGLTNLGAMSGDSAALDRIALALGQIYTKGKLSAEEMRQLANAYIPITDILQDKFGLTGDDLKRVGDLNLPAADVINAIVDYANENFGSVGDAAMHTITGIQNRIVDTLKVVGAGMLQPLTNMYKSFLAYISSGLESIRSAYDAGGIGGVFEYLVPDESTQRVIRQFLANVHNLLMSLASVGVVAGKVFGNVASVVANAFNILSPLIIGAVNTLTMLINRFLSTEAGAATLRVALVGAAAAFVLLKVQALGALVITAVTKAVAGLSKALMLLSTIISKHPIVALLVTLGAVLLGISASSSKANSSISGLFDTLSGAAGGTKSDEVLQRVNQNLKDSANAADQFNNRLEDSAGAANKLSNAISGAGKEAKKTAGLLSFDEVFKLPEQKDDSGGSSGVGTGGLLGDLENLTAGFKNLGDALIPSIPDFGDFASAFADNLFGGLDKSISDKIKSAGIGSMIGTLLGLIVGTIFKNPKLGAQIGSALGGFIGLIWDEFEGAISNLVVGSGAGIGAAISKAFGGATLSQIFKTALTTGSIDDIFKAIGQMFSATGGKAILKGGAIGMAVGFVVDGIAHLLWSWLDEKIGAADAEAAKVGQTIGSLLGTVVGAFFGPVGALIGSAIGTFVGGFIGLFWDPIKNFFVDLGTAIGRWFADLWDSIDTWWNETSGIGPWLRQTWSIVSTWWTDTISGFSAWCSNTWSLLSTWWTDTKDKFSKWWSDTWSPLSTWWSDTISGFSDWWKDTKDRISSWWTDTVGIFSNWGSINSDTLGTWWSNTKEGFVQWITDTWQSLSTWWNDTVSGFGIWWGNIKEGFAQWFAELVVGIAKWAIDTWQSLSAWWEDTKTGFGNWWGNIKENFAQWFAELVVRITQWCIDTFNAIEQWATDVWKKFTEWAVDVVGVIGGFVIAAALAFAQWLSDTRQGFSDWWSNIKDGFAQWCTDLVASIAQWCLDTLGAIRQWATDVWKKFTDWSANVVGVITGFAVNAALAISQWISNTFGAIGQWATDVWQRFTDWSANVVGVITGFATTAAAAIGQWLLDTWNSFSTWFTNTAENIRSWWKNLFNADTWASGWSSVKSWFANLFNSVSNWFTSTVGKVTSWWKSLFNINNWASGWSSVSTWFVNLFSRLSGWFADTTSNITTWWKNLFSIDKWSSGWSIVKTWFSDLRTSISTWFTNLGTSVSTWWKNLWNGKEVTVNTNNSGSTPKASLSGHATGGVFNREHIARFAENNKAEAIIPLENNRAMQPFVDAVSNGIVGSLAPIVASINTSNSSNLPPLYVGTLIADDRGLKELYKKFEIIQLQENDRRGIHATV